jgi:hypothetical protein
MNRFFASSPVLPALRRARFQCLASGAAAGLAGLVSATPAAAQPAHITQYAHPQPANVQATSAWLSSRRASLAPTVVADNGSCPADNSKGPKAVVHKTALNASAKAASPEAINRLRVGTVVQFDARTRTVGDAMNSLLLPVRYRLTTRTVDPAVSSAVMRRPLPVATREAGLMTIEQALLMLIGEEHRIVVDHRARLVAIERAVAAQR